MLIEAYRSQIGPFIWLDVNDPSGADLEYIIKTYNLNSASVRDCLTPQHLPKYEEIGEDIFIILRAFDERAKNSGTVRGITQKIAIFIGQNYIITIHRKDLSYMVEMRNWVKKQHDLGDKALSKILLHIMESVFATYREALYRCEVSVEEFENKIFKAESTQLSIQQKFQLKRKILVIRRMLKMTLDILPKLKTRYHLSAIKFHEVHELGQNQYYLSEEVLENVNNLINLQLTLASHQTSEVVRVLTLFSVFFMPLSFIVGFYGMNFKNFPSLEFEYALPALLLFMLSIECILYLWFKRKKWIK